MKKLRTLRFPNSTDVYELVPHYDNIEGKPFGEIPTESGSDTLTSDSVNYGGFCKVSDVVPVYSKVNKGGTISYYDHKGELVTGNYKESPWGVHAKNSGVLISSDGIPMVIISYTDDPDFSPFSFDITEPGVYFRQASDSIVHSFTINEFTEFPGVELVKIPEEWLPEGIGGGADWNAAEGEKGYIANKPFGETTVMGDTLTWDGNTEGLVSAMDMFYRISDCTPTLEELQQGGSVELALVGSAPFDSDAVIEMGENLLAITMDGDPLVVIALVDNAVFDDGNGELIPFEKAGIYSIYIDGTYTTSLVINNYTGFEMTEIKTIDPKYLPGEKITFKINSTNLGWTDDAVVSCDKSLSQLRSMAIDNLNSISISWENASEEVAICQPLSMSITEIGVSCTFGYVNGYELVLYSIIYMAEGMQVIKLE